MTKSRRQGNPPSTAWSGPIGLIGAGLLGTALAGRLLGAGFEVVVCDLSAARRKVLARMGARAVESAEAVAHSCPRIVLSLPTTKDVALVIRAMGESLRRGTLLIDTTTGEPGATARLASKLEVRGVRYLDATVLGSSADMQTGRALTLVGGTPAAFKGARDILEAISIKAFHVGRRGAGARMKLVANLVLGLHRAVLAEGLAFARRIGVDPALALEILQAGAAYSRVMDTKGEKMLRGDFKPVARLAQHLKDVRLILALGAKHHATLPLSTLHCGLLEEVESAGGGALDNSAIIRAFA